MREYQGGTHARPRPHYRVGHWRYQAHGKGSIKDPTKRKWRHQWIPPVLVNVKDIDKDLIPNIKPVEPADSKIKEQ